MNQRQPFPESQKAVLPEAAADIADTIAYIEQGSFHSEIDRTIATSLCGAIEWNAAEGLITPEVRAEALASLRALVPVVGEDGRRRIDGQPLSIATERWIASRLNSAEVDIAGPNGSWGRLPELVRREIASPGNELRLELTTNCTAACSFCSFADKGPIAAKASFGSAVAVMSEFASHPAPPGAGTLVDSLYWGTDPFDAKWNNGGLELDYRDLAMAYASLAHGNNRALGTSTAVPIGEEFRVMDFVRLTSELRWLPVRISVTDKNASRVDRIGKVLKAAVPGYETAIRPMSFLKRQGPALRGRAAWSRARPEDIRAWDIVGPNCADGAIIGVKGVDAVIMQGASSERPNGETREPVYAGKDEHGNSRYIVPRNNVRTDDSEGADAYPDVQVSIFTYDPGGRFIERYTEVRTNDPHRALLRLMGAWASLKATGVKGNAASFMRQYQQSVEAIRRYLGEGNTNPSMVRALGILAEAGLIQGDG